MNCFSFKEFKIANIIDFISSNECDDISSHIENTQNIKNMKILNENSFVNQYRIRFIDSYLKKLLENKLSNYNFNELTDGKFIEVEKSFSYVKYENEGKIKKHIDSYESVKTRNSNHILTLIIYLNDKYDDGETYLSSEFSEDNAENITLNKKKDHVMFFMDQKFFMVAIKLMAQN